MKKLICLFLAAVLAVSVSACKDEAKADTVRMAVLKGPTGIGAVTLMENTANGATVNKYEFSAYGAPDEISAKLIKGELDIASVPTNLAAVLYGKTKGGVTVLAVNTYGVLSVLENGETVSSLSDLRGKEIYLTGEGSNPEYILRHLLKSNGVDPDSDVTLRFVSNNDELVGLLVNGTAKLAMVPEPAATTVLTKKTELRRALDLTREWENVSPDSELMMGCVVAKKDYIASHSGTVKTFLEEYKGSVDALADTAAVAALCEKYEIVPSAAIAEKAIPYCHIGFCEGEQMKEKLSGYLDVLFAFDPSSVGGALPGEDFYHIP